MDLRNTFIIGAPFSANNMYVPSAKFGMVKSKKYKKWIEINLEKIKHNDKIANFPVDIEICVFGGRGFGKKADVDNIIKPIGDLLVKANIIPDDNHNFIRRYDVRFMDFWHQKGESTTVITIIQPEI